MIQKVLVANRGEIALRVMRACREERVESVAIYTAGEELSHHVRYADEAIEITSDNPLPYVDIQAVLSAAIESGADAIHPGYGFLAENADFARSCVDAGVVFIGPPADAIEAMGDKVSARAVARRANVPIVPGSDGPVDVAGAREFAENVGFPIALKAVAGGGGRGFRVAWDEHAIQDVWEQARGEGQRYFGNPTVYAEKYLDRPRHIEIQIFADQHGAVVGLGERDCSIQRRHQKLIEEAPSPALSSGLRAEMNETAVRLAREVGYVGAGTVEFLFSEGAFYFLEMNTRIQVEHPITEEITGIDLVRQQLRVAEGEPLAFGSDSGFYGHAIECRINAEDPAQGFSPSPGKLQSFRPPTGFGVRVDTGFDAGDEVDPRFDNLVAKLVVRGRDRVEALSRLDRALADFEISGVATTIELYRHVLRRPEFQTGEYDTHFLERTGVARGLKPARLPEEQAVEPDAIVVQVNGRDYHVRLPEELLGGGGRDRRRTPVRATGSRAGNTPTASGSGDLKSPIQGTVLNVAVRVGDQVAAGDLVCIVEAMKMENELTAPKSGVVQELHAQAGATVRNGDLLAVIGD